MGDDEVKRDFVEMRLVYRQLFAVFNDAFAGDEDEKRAESLSLDDTVTALRAVANAFEEIILKAIDLAEKQFCKKVNRKLKGMHNWKTSTIEEIKAVVDPIEQQKIPATFDDDKEFDLYKSTKQLTDKRGL